MHGAKEHCLIAGIGETLLLAIIIRAPSNYISHCKAIAAKSWQWLCVWILTEGSHLLASGQAQKHAKTLTGHGTTCACLANKCQFPGIRDFYNMFLTMLTQTRPCHSCAPRIHCCRGLAVNQSCGGMQWRRWLVGRQTLHQQLM